MNEATNALGATMRKVALEDGYCTREIGTLIVRVTRHGADWALELCDETPIDAVTMEMWRKAVGAPVFGEWRGTAGGRVMRFAWEGTEDAAPEGSAVTWMGGAK